MAFTGRQRYNELVRALGRGGYDLTPQREAVLRVLADSTQHPTAEQMQGKARQRCRSTSRATVYNTVTVLKQLGEVEDLKDCEGTAHRYGARVTAEHAHLVCAHALRSYRRLRIHRITGDVGGRGHGERLPCGRFSGLSFYGECPACQGPIDRPDQERPDD